MKTGKIEKSVFKSTWSGPKGNVEYHDIKFEGDDTTYNIGAKDKNPDFLAVGQTLTYEVPDATKPNKIKRAKEFTPGGGNFKPDGGIGMQIGNALNVTALLIAHGKVELKDLESTARRVIEISNKLKEENTK